MWTHREVSTWGIVDTSERIVVETNGREYGEDDPDSRNGHGGHDARSGEGLMKAHLIGPSYG